MLTGRVWKSLPKLRALGPYLVIELVLPGGTLLALLLWLSQRIRRTGTGAMQRIAWRQANARPAIEGKPHTNGAGQIAPPLSVQPV